MKGGLEGVRRGKRVGYVNVYGRVERGSERWQRSHGQCGGEVHGQGYVEVWKDDIRGSKLAAARKASSRRPAYLLGG